MSNDNLLQGYRPSTVVKRLIVQNSFFSIQRLKCRFSPLRKIPGHWKIRKIPIKQYVFVRIVRSDILHLISFVFCDNELAFLSVQPRDECWFMCFNVYCVLLREFPVVLHGTWSKKTIVLRSKPCAQEHFCICALCAMISRIFEYTLVE